MRRQDARVAVITGASAGVGRATARLLARRGIAIALLARGRAGLDAAAEEVRAAGSRALPIEVDMAEYDQVVAAGSGWRPNWGRSTSGSTTPSARSSRPSSRPDPRSSGARPRSPTSATCTAPASRSPT